MTVQQAAMGPVEWALIVLLSVIWGGTFIFIELALTGLPPVTLVTVRLLMAAAGLHLYLLFTGHRLPLEPRLWAMLVVLGIFNNVVPFNLINFGQTQVNASLASILVATTPIWGVLIAHMLTRDERMTPGRAAGVLLGFAGVAVMSGHDALEGLSYGVLAQLALIGAGLSYAFSGVFAKRATGLPPVVIATGQLTASAILSVPLAFALEDPLALPVPSAMAIWATVALALLCTSAAYLIYFRVLAKAGATNVLLVTFLIPVSALMMGMGLLGETLEPKHFLGMALIGLGLAAIDGRPARIISARAMGGAGTR